MRPILDTIKADKVVDENFESVKSVLCGNVSYDNMSIRILEGTTGSVDTQNQVIHSGSSRPVGWFPLVGDVYVQEISDRYIDIRSTKPDVNYKIMILFGSQITDSALKAIGGSGYQDTTDQITEITDQQIELIEQLQIQYKPLAIQAEILPNPCDPAEVPNNQYESVITDGEYFYIVVFNPTAANKFLWRIHRSTGVVDSLDLTASIGTSHLYYMVGQGTNIYLQLGRGDVYTKGAVLEIPISTFTVANTWEVGDNSYNPRSIHVNDTHVYMGMESINRQNARLYRILKSTGASDYVTIGPYTSSASKLYNVGGITEAPCNNTNTTALWVVLDNDYKTGPEVVRVAIYDWVALNHVFTITDTILSTVAIQAENCIYHSGYIYAPVSYSSNHQTAGGTTGYISGIVTINYDQPYAVDFIPATVTSETGGAFIRTIVEDSDYLYMVTYNASYPGGTVIYRYDTLTGLIVTGYIPLEISGRGTYGFNNLICKDTDGTLFYIGNLGSTTYGNFVFATVDFTDYDLT